MGQKVNPIGIRLGFVRKSNAFWFPDGDTFANTLRNDIEIRKYIFDNLPKSSAVSKILIERISQNVKITISTAKPGIVIGKKGEDIERLRSKLSCIYKISVSINIEEIKKPDLDAYLVADSIASQLKRRVMFRRAMKRAILNAMKQGALGIKVCVSGRLGGAEIARREWYKEGRIPLHTFRANIDYGFSEAKTTYGVIGVKVWINKGDVVFLDKIKK
ncbi:MAG TPA: 30S ribosomal protein S3 [Candidatus Azoamicus sp. OHIO1]